MFFFISECELVWFVSVGLIRIKNDMLLSFT